MATYNRSLRYAALACCLGQGAAAAETKFSIFGIKAGMTASEVKQTLTARHDMVVTDKIGNNALLGRRFVQFSIGEEKNTSVQVAYSPMFDAAVEIGRSTYYPTKTGPTISSVWSELEKLYGPPSSTFGDMIHWWTIDVSGNNVDDPNICPVLDTGIQVALTKQLIPLHKKINTKCQVIFEVSLSEDYASGAKLVGMMGQTILSHTLAKRSMEEMKAKRDAVDSAAREATMTAAEKVRPDL